MNMAFKSWLPDEALCGGAIERELRSVAGAWSEAWFARQLVGLLDPPIHAYGRPPEADEDMNCRVHPDGLAIAMPATAGREFAGLMLDFNVESGPLRPADRLLLDRLGERCIADLCDRLGSAFGFVDSDWREADAVPAQSNASFYRLGLTAGVTLLHIAVETPAAVALIKSRTHVTPKPAPLQPIQAALKQQQVALSGRLGGCAISLADLAALAPGDVVVLDREVDQPLELAVEGRASPGRCTAEQADGRLQLKIVKPLSG